ncbi:zinc-binding dehydrogenase [Microbispora sp. NPDC049125]|uniref:zinc-binding dehydrogenase n=1 Tax=Microbispora sp. NPDC049125 TaxID=3154929 RepID=UPI0034652096
MGRCYWAIDDRIVTFELLVHHRRPAQPPSQRYGWWRAGTRRRHGRHHRLIQAARPVYGRLNAKPSRVFRFEEIREAHRVMEAGEAGGKMVVVHS